MTKGQTSRGNDHAEPLKLHSHRALDDAGTPRMTEAMARCIARSPEPQPRRGDPPTPLSFADAWARLRNEEPPLAAAVTQTVIHRLTVRDAGPVLGCGSATAARRKGAGLAALSIWTGLPVVAVARQIATLTA